MSVKDTAKTVYTKKELRKKNRSSTPGKDKGGNCVASRIDRFCAKYSRARKDPQYQEWLIKTRKANKQ